MQYLAILALGIGCSFAESRDFLAAGGPAGLEVEDIFRLQTLGSTFEFSSNNGLMAFVVKRPVAEQPERYYAFNHDRAEIWIADLESGRSSRLVPLPSQDGESWHPRWSPDGTRLAFLSNVGTVDGAYRVWVWHRLTDAFTKFPDHEPDIDNDISIGQRDHLLHWFSNTHLFYPTLGEGAAPSEPRTNRHTLADLTERYRVSLGGASATAMVFDGGVPTNAEHVLAAGQAVVCNVDSTRCALALTSYHRPRMVYEGVALPSSSGDTLALLELHAQMPPSDGREPYGYNWVEHRLRLVNIGGEVRPEGLASVRRVVPGSMRWSRDGMRLAFVGEVDGEVGDSSVPAGQRRGENQIWVLDVASGALTHQTLADVRLFAQRAVSFLYPRYSMVWLRDRLVIRGTGILSDGREEDGWWTGGESGTPTNLVQGLDFVPSAIVPIADDSDWLAVVDGGLWMSSSGNRLEPIETLGTDSSSALVWMDGSPARGQSVGTVVLSSRDQNGRSSILAMSHPFQDVHVIPSPGDGAEFRGFGTGAMAAAFLREADDGTDVWVVSQDATAPRPVFSANTFLRVVEPGEVRSFPYESLSGESLTGWVLLPVGYEEGTTYPMVTWVYQSEVHRARPYLSKASTANPLNMQILASRGYVVLFPSMPGRLHDFDRLLEGVMPAVDEVIRMGIADPDRLAVMGQSNGGFSTNGIITQTNRFQAAISKAGMSELQSISLQFPAPKLTGDVWEAGPTFGRLPMLESHFGFGLPWRGPDYRKNSPLTHVDRVTTPLLLLHGDFDGVPIQQAEQLFVALQRLGKRVRLVRYPGDDHVFQSPANIRHSWDQTFAWLEQFLRPDENEKFSSESASAD